MGLSDSLYTGLTGLNVNEAQLNVIANNIANVNTVAFKSSRALFQTQFYVTNDAGTAPTTNFGGTDQPYFFYRRNRLPWPIRWLK